MKRNIYIASFIVVLHCSCETNEVVREYFQPLVSNTSNTVKVETYSEGGFVSGFWAKEFSLDVVADGDLNFNVDWSYIKTYVENGKPMLFIQDPMDGLTYELIFNDSSFDLSNEYAMSESYEQIKFDPTGLNYITSYRIDSYRIEPYLAIDSGRVIYDYFFEGSYFSKGNESPRNIELGCKGDLSGWEGFNRYESHYDFKKPVFIVKNDETVAKTFYIQDYNGGFQLFEIPNETDLLDPESTVEIGELKHTFVKN
ncbi:MAG: hypothetical protein JKY54_18760 [Flavobacteriales bacterium]|nr:hypothetical protein [Flavobacteriales bacterium]